METIEKFYVSMMDTDFKVGLKSNLFDSYDEALTHIKTLTIEGVFSINKVFINKIKK